MCFYLLPRKTRVEVRVEALRGVGVQRDVEGVHALQHPQVFGGRGRPWRGERAVPALVARYFVVWSSILRVCSLLLFVSESSDAIAFVPVVAYFYTVSVRFSGVTLAFTSNERVYLGTGSESLKICMLECAYGR